MNINKKFACLQGKMFLSQMSYSELFCLPNPPSNIDSSELTLGMFVVPLLEKPLEKMGQSIALTQLPGVNESRIWASILEHQGKISCPNWASRNVLSKMYFQVTY